MYINLSRINKNYRLMSFKVFGRDQDINLGLFDGDSKCIQNSLFLDVINQHLSHINFCGKNVNKKFYS